MTGPTGHSPFGASVAHRWTECPGSVQAQHGLPDKSGPEAQEGTGLHAVAASCLENGRDAIEWVDREFHYEDHGEYKKIEIDADQAECVQLYLDTIRADLADFGADYVLLVEQRFHLSHLHPDFYGTCDAVIVHKHTRYPVRVYDLKTGRGHVVEVRSPATRKINQQLGYYGLGAIGGNRISEGVELCIVQPRAYHPDGPVRRTFATWSELVELATDLMDAAAVAGYPDAQRRPGSWCTFCRAAPTCTELREHTYDRADLVWMDDGTVPSFELSAADPDVHKIVKVLAAADVIEDYIKAARAYAHSLAERGYDIPGYKLVDRVARRHWIDPVWAAAVLRFDFGLDHNSIFKQSILSPAQMEKLVPKEKRGALTQLWSKESSGRTLVKADNPRPAVLPSSTTAFPEDENTE